MMVLKMRYENPRKDYVKDLEPRECYYCDKFMVCKYKRYLGDALNLLPTRNSMDMGIVGAWMYSWAVFCPYFKPEEAEEDGED